MKSVRLTKDLRSRILESYLACYDASNPKPKQYTVSIVESDFAEILRKRMFEKAKVDETAIPSEFLTKDSDITVVFPDDTYTRLRFKDADGYTEYRNKPKQDGAIRILDNDPAYISFKEGKRNIKELNKIFESWDSQRNHVSEQVRMALDSVNTTGQLLSVWPEAEQFIPSDVLDFSKIQLPSVSFSSLNQAVGI